MTFLYVIIGFILLTVLYWIILPFLNPKSDDTVETDVDTPSSPQIEQLLDLEYDYRTGKIDADEYQKARQEILGKSG